MNIFHEATQRMEEKNRHNPAIYRIVGSVQELNGIKSLYGIEREIEEDIRGGYFLRLPFEIADIIDSAIKIRSELDRI
jgi:hypothetical protein